MPSKRDFYDDVSHELRTPLTVLRGHLEVMDTDDPADVARARALAVSEVERMTRLVDDLVTLASAERPDFVRLRSIDAATLTDEISGRRRLSGTGGGSSETWRMRGSRWMLSASPKPCWSWPAMP